MRKLLNTFYVTLPDVYLSLDGENIVVKQDSETLKRVPLHNLEGIVTFGYTGASPALMGACAEKGISLTFLTSTGRFLASVSGMEKGNVTLRKTQYKRSDNEEESCAIARNILTGKLHNSRWVLERAVRDHALRIDAEKVQRAAQQVANAIPLLRQAETSGVLFGIEGEAASRYFSAFDELILHNKKHFFFHSRSRRPPLDNVNAMLSFVYTLLEGDITAALNAVGLDPYVGFLHKDRPGRRSLALDLMEELRAPLADRFVITLINTRQIDFSGFFQKENGAVLMRDDTRRDFLSAWQTRKSEKISHPFLKEKIEWGLVAHAQALLLARTLRDDLDEYPPFLWK
ncbi:MAG: type I-C CRISPR-associated endonuclease Cas1c [Defluviitaleaceae bacterium]|nr:type I-C CRISPR-associated endonuclease Cas1c [Defluviitaleaceae bacterium]